MMAQTVSVSLLPDQIDPRQDLSDRCAVVVDILRATSVMATAGASGVRKIHTCRTTQESEALARRLEPRPLLCGERECKPIRGFDLGNSPAEYDRRTVGGREIILTTTNGTRAIDAVLNAHRLLTASFLNLGATAKAVCDEQRVHIVCAGTNGTITLEDVLFSGALVDRLSVAGDVALENDESRIALACWKQCERHEHGLAVQLRSSLGGRNLIAAGYDEDIERCARIDSVPGIVIRSENVDHESDRAVFEYQMR